MLLMGLNHQQLYDHGKQAGGPPVHAGGGTYLFPDGSCVNQYSMSYPQEPERVWSAKRNYWQTLMDIVTEDVKQLERALNLVPCNTRLTTPFRWPNPDTTLFQHYGPCPAKHGMPDNEAALQRLRDIIANCNAKIAELEGDTRYYRGGVNEARSHDITMGMV